MTKDRSHGRQGDPPPAPEPLPYPVVDNHTHLDLVIDTVGGSVADQVAAAADVGVDRLIQVGVDLPTSNWSVAAAVANPAVLAAVALHPNAAPLMTERELDTALDEIDKLAAHGRVRAIGETGLDFFRTTEAAQLAQQERSFRAHIRIAKKHQLPVMIHDRDAHDDVFGVLADEGAPEHVVFHCFSGDAKMAQYCAEMGYYISFAGNCTFAKAQQLQDAATVAAAGLILVETDAPFLTPAPYRGRPNAPYLVPLTVRGIAQSRPEPLDELCQIISDNSERLYGPW